MDFSESLYALRDSTGTDYNCTGLGNRSGFTFLLHTFPRHCLPHPSAIQWCRILQPRQILHQQDYNIIRSLARKGAIPRPIVPFVGPRAVAPKAQPKTKTGGPVNSLHSRTYHQSTMSIHHWFGFRRYQRMNGTPTAEYSGGRLVHQNRRD